MVNKLINYSDCGDTECTGREGNFVENDLS